VALGKLRNGQLAELRSPETSGQASDGKSCVCRDVSLTGLSAPRRLGERDRPALCEHLLHLSNKDRSLRFFRVMDDAGILAYARNIDFGRDPCFAIFDSEEHLIALAETFPDTHGSVKRVEVAFSTDAQWRCQGLARRLFSEVTRHACATGAQRVIAQCLAANHAMRGLLGAVGAVCAIDDGEVNGEVEILRAAA